MRSIDAWLLAQKQRDLVACPQCNAEVDTSDGERMQGHVTYWGDDEPQPITCNSCNADFYLKEIVTRRWQAGRTPDEACDL